MLNRSIQIRPSLVTGNKNNIGRFIESQKRTSLLPLSLSEGHLRGSFALCVVCMYTCRDLACCSLFQTRFGDGPKHKWVA